MREIYVVIHAEASHHTSRSMGGWLDTPLTERGHEQAKRAGRHLASLLAGNEPPPVYSSDLCRAQETARLVAAELGTGIVVDANLREMRFGEAEGRPSSWLHAHRAPFPAAPVARLDHRICPGAETRREVASRIYRAMRHITGQPAERAVIVSHSFSFTFLITAWLEIPIGALAFCSFAARPAAISLLRQDERWGYRTVASLDRTGHLGELPTIG